MASRMRLNSKTGRLFRSLRSTRKVLAARNNPRPLELDDGAGYRPCGPAAAARTGVAGRRADITEDLMTLSTILIIVLILLLLGLIPAWPYSRGWGYTPGGVVGIILVIVVILALMGRL
jgi:hypothetical protein